MRTTQHERHGLVVARSLLWGGLAMLVILLVATAILALAQQGMPN